MTFANAYLGGFLSFFSVWIFCLLQIIPFFLAFMVGAALSDKSENPSPRPGLRALLIPVIALIGYSVVFTSMGMTTTGISKVIFKHLDLANQFGGVVIGLVACYLVGWLSFKGPSTAYMRMIYIASSLAFGAALAFAYRPCVTPTLTVILNLNNNVETAGVGAVMLAFYTLGTATVLLAGGVGLALLSMRIPSDSMKIFLKRFCAIVLFTASFLILSDRMTDYKSFLVGRFVPMASTAGPNGGGH